MILIAGPSFKCLGPAVRLGVGSQREADPFGCIQGQGDLRQVGRFIRTRKVSLDTIYPSGLAALHEAVLSGNLECVKLLVKHGADIHQRDETGWTALHMACSDGYPDIARYLISLGANIDVANDDGDLPSDLIDPDYTDLVELFKGATMD
uniref:Protein phosphatase 1 regulatory subunit 27 n=1 Tax=Sarcophilus harrisii TaxID=9305 RepID=G3WCY5_SARHA